MLNWERLEPERIERAVKMLLRELYPTAQGINGAGGDGGRDASMPIDGGLRIFEIKSFTATLSGSQKRQIGRSLQAAVQHDDLREWILIMPHDPTPGELSWFNGVLAAHAPGVALEWWGRDWLDGQFAPRMHLRRYVEGPDAELLERSKTFEKEQAVLAGGLPDVARRQAALGGLADELSPFWRVTPGMAKDGATKIEVTERSPGDADRDPIVFNARFLEGLADPEASRIQESYRQVIDFGGSVAIPGDYLEGLELTTSPETAALFGDLNATPLTHLEVSSLPDTTELGGVLQAVDADGVQIASIDVVFIERHRGQRGLTAVARDSSGLLTLQLQATDPGQDIDQSSTLQIAMAPAVGSQPERVAPLLAVLAAAERGAELRVRVGPTTICSTTVPDDPERSAEVDQLADLVAALTTIQDHVGQIVPVPGELTAGQSEMVQMLARAIRGEWVRLREDVWKPEIEAERLDSFLELFQQSTRGVRLDIPDGMFDLEGKTYHLGEIAYVALGLTLSNADELSGRSGDSDRVTARFTAENGLWLMPIPAPPAGERLVPPASHA